MPIEPNATGAVLASRQMPAAKNGEKPSPVSIAAATATGVPKPGRALDERAERRTRSASPAGGGPSVRPPIESLMISKLPVSSVRGRARRPRRRSSRSAQAEGGAHQGGQHGEIAGHAEGEDRRRRGPWRAPRAPTSTPVCAVRRSGAAARRSGVRRRASKARRYREGRNCVPAGTGRFSCFRRCRSRRCRRRSR